MYTHSPLKIDELNEYKKTDIISQVWSDLLKNPTMTNDATLMAESEDELKSLLMRLKEES